MDLLVTEWEGTCGMGFEENLPCYSRAKYAITKMNKTLAMYTALCYLGVGTVDEKIVTSYSFIKS